MTKLAFLTTISLLAVALSGCTDNEVITQKGSSTVLPLALVWSDDYHDRTGAVVEVAGGGSGLGASGLCDGTLDLGDMSRDFKGYDHWKETGEATDEVKTCLDNGITPLRWTVAFDGLSVVVDRSNTFAKDLSTEQLADIFGQGGASRWSDVEPPVPGAPNTQIKRCIPDNESGTYEYFFEAVLEHEMGSSADFADAEQSPNDNVLVDCLRGDANAVGFFGYAYVVANPNAVKAVKVNGVTPTAATIEDGSYAPLSRPLFVMSRDPPSDLVRDYLEYIFTDGQDRVADTGYVPLSTSVRGAMQQQLAASAPQ